jgi:hypothetical protein
MDAVHPFRAMPTSCSEGMASSFSGMPEHVVVFVGIRTREQALSKELAAPLVLRFPAEFPVYPLMLTSTSGQETEVLLYILSHHKWQNEGRLDLIFAGRTRLPRGDEWIASFEPEGFFARKDLALPYLCKFRGRLAPEQMQEDLLFKLAENDEPYPKRTVTW